MEQANDILTVTIRDTDKRALKILAAQQGTTMRTIVRDLIRKAVQAEEANDDALPA